MAFFSAFAYKSSKSTEIGLLLGLTYYTGELNQNGHFRPGFMHPAFGGMLRRNFNQRWAFRLMGIYGKVSGSDAVAGASVFEQNRNLSFFSTISELSGQIEFNFFPFSAADVESYYATPFVFWGAGIFHFSPKSNKEGNKVDLRAQQYEDKTYLKINASMPFGLGFRFRAGQRFFASLEWGMRKTFTDYIDDVSTVYAQNGIQRGDSQSKDWFAFAGASISVRIGRKYNSCDFDQGSGKHRRKKIFDLSDSFAR
ncbi:MAG: hypothetical protein COA57_11870 [Flavobacteriales bacterium]|nr:MAG: hypothetical protein COA57_11870 [Flavobacteriales bacterium]